MRVIAMSVLLGGIACMTHQMQAQDGKSTHHALGTSLVPAGTLYSPGVQVDGAIYISGLQGTDPHTHKLPSDFQREVRLSLDNVGHVLSEGGMGYTDVVSVQIYLIDMNNFSQVNAIYKEYFTGVLPARTVVQVAKLSLGSRIEVSAIARH